MLIRPIKAEDVNSCLDIYNYYIKSTCVTLEEKELTLSDYEARVSDILKNYPYIVAENDGGAVVGFAYLDVFNFRSAYRCTADLTIYVDHYSMHKHIGALLLSEIEAAAKNRGIKNLISIITQSNTDSCGFHEANGFMLEGVIKNVAVKFGDVLSVCYYRKEL